MSVSISKEAFAILSRLNTQGDGIRYQDLKHIDADKNNTISASEAQQVGLDPKLFNNDIQQLNRALKEYKDFSPTELVFASPTSVPVKNAPSAPSSVPTPATKIPPPSPEHKQPNPAATFSPEEVKELTQRYGLHANQSNLERIVSNTTDAVSWKHEQALYKIDAHAAAIQETAQRYNLNPKVLGAILYDEIRHVKPGESLAVAAGTAKTFGMAQLGNAELVRHGFFEQDLQRLIRSGVYDQDLQSINKNKASATPAQLIQHLGPDKVVSRFPADVRQKGIDYLMDNKNNIDTLGRQLNRIRSMLNIPSSDRLTTDTFENTHNTAKVVVFHNGRLDYAARILEYMEIPELERALQGKYPE